MSKLIGRDSEIYLIKSYINEMKSFHIYGPEGVGKTSILEFIHNNWNDLKTPLLPIFCRTSRTLREILVRVSGFLLYRFGNLQNIDKFKRVKQIRCPSDLKAVNSRYLKNIIFRNIGSKKFCIILDHLEYVTPKINAFLTPLKDVAVTITSSRQSWELRDYKFKGNLGYSLYLFPKLKMTNLPNKDAYLLMEHLYGTMCLKVPDKDHLFNEIFHITKGNPKMITELLERAQRPEYFKNQICDLKLMQIDQNIEKLLNK
jgi:hypothetical protein